MNERGIVTCTICGAQSASADERSLLMICKDCENPARELASGLGKLAARAVGERLQREAPLAFDLASAVYGALRRHSSAAED